VVSKVLQFYFILANFFKSTFIFILFSPKIAKIRPKNKGKKKIGETLVFFIVGWGVHWE
jgi:hypothetical protein